MSDSATPVDFLPENTPQMQPIPQGVPITPPSPVQAPPYNGHAKHLMKTGEPVVQETITRQTIGPRSSMQQELPGVMNAAGRSATDLLQNIATDPDSQGFTIQIERNGPARFNGVMFPVGPIETISPPMPYRDVYDRVRELHGGGKYTLRVLNEHGIPQRATVTFIIDSNAYPPIPLQNVQQQPGQRVVGGVGMPVGFGVSEDLIKLREADSIMRAKKTAVESEWALEDATQNREDRKQQREELKDKRAMMPELMSVRSEIKDVVNVMDRRMEQMQNNFEKTITMLLTTNSKPQTDNGMMTVLATMIKSMSDSQTAILAAMVGKKDDGGGAAMQMMMQANEKISQMAINNANSMLATAAAQSGKHEKLLETMIVSKLEHPDKAVEQALALRQDGWKQAMDMYEMLEERSGGRDAEEVINPENGFFSNLGNVILNALQGVASGGMKGAGKSILSAIGAGLGKPAGQMLSQADLLQAARIMEQQQLQKTGQLPQQRPVQQFVQRPMQQIVQAPVQRPVQRQAQRNNGVAAHWFNAWYEADMLVAIEQRVEQAPVPEASQEEVEQSVQTVEHVEEVVAQPEQIEIQQSVEQVTEVIENEEELTPLQTEVNEALQIMKTDLTRKVREQEWVDYALNKWDGDFLTQISEAPDDNQRTVLIRQQANAELWSEIENALLTDAKKYELYLLNLQALVQLVRSPETSNA